VLRHAGQSDDSFAVAPSAAAVAIAAFATEEDEARGIAQRVRDLAGPTRSWSSCAVLARTVVQLKPIARALEQLGIPVSVQGGATSNRAVNAVLAEAYSRRGSIELGQWVDEVNGETSADPIRIRVAEVADRYLAEAVSIPFRDWVEARGAFEDLDDAPSDGAVDLLTFHAAKGREWQTVVIAGAETGLVPHSSAVTAAQRAEEARLLYVACTRAREQLTITWSARRRDKPSRRSPLIDDIGDGHDVPVPPPSPRAPRPEPDHVYVALVAWRRNAAKAAHVDPVAICSDDTLRAVAQARPSTVEAVAMLTNLGPLSAARLAPRLLAALNQALSASPTPDVAPSGSGRPHLR
jgi:DNA helicase-2/ATP-dependent DNA helicase PcrA